MARGYPEETEMELYLPWEWEEHSLQELIEAAQEKWFGVDFEDVKVSVERVKVTGCNCCYDESDYLNFILLKKKKIN